MVTRAVKVWGPGPDSCSFKPSGCRGDRVSYLKHFGTHTCTVCTSGPTACHALPHLGAGPWRSLPASAAGQCTQIDRPVATPGQRGDHSSRPTTSRAITPIRAAQAAVRGMVARSERAARRGEALSFFWVESGRYCDLPMLESERACQSEGCRSQGTGRNCW